MKSRNVRNLLSAFSMCLFLSGCSTSGSPSPIPTKTVYLPAPAQNNGNLGSFSENELQDQLDSAKQAACDSANAIQWQWIQLNNQLSQIEMNGLNGISGDINLDRQVTQLRFQVLQLQQQESNLRQQCEG